MTSWSSKLHKAGDDQSTAYRVLSTGYSVKQMGNQEKRKLKIHRTQDVVHNSKTTWKIQLLATR